MFEFIPRVTKVSSLNSVPRVALFTDSFHETNGVATVSRQFVAFAQRRDIPFCSVYGGKETRVAQQGSVLTIELKRSLASFPVDNGLYSDPLLSRYKNWMLERLSPFQPDLIHITGPGDVGILGFWMAHCLKIPLVASWHTNLHEFVSRRLLKSLSFLPGGSRERVASFSESQVLRALVKFYRLAYFGLAPNPTMVDLLHDLTGRNVYLMKHGVDVELFSPARRERTQGGFCIGYVGRLTPEKNVRAFAELERKLVAAGEKDFRLLLVGEGGEREWLKKNLRFGELPGVLHGERLASAFASMDAFVFPSRTDTFGLVILEAMASGVPVIINPDTGARVGISDRCAGFLSEDFMESVLELMKSDALRQKMGYEARRFACSKVWSGVFEDLYDTYAVGLDTEEVRDRLARKRASLVQR
jgi:phosphatidylinositol alpha 1,6-mannosyltransferase